MTDKTEVIFNGSCPICSKEIALYQRRAERSDAPVAFVDLTEADLGAYQLTADEAARSLHVVENGQMLEGVDAFRAMWRATPGFRWLAWLTGLPVIKQVVGLVYRRVLAPRLYAMHRKRQAQAAP